MNVAIITDSTCDLGPAAEIAYQIDIVPLLIAFGAKVFQDGIDLTNEEFYLRLSKANSLPTTSQPAPAAFESLFRRRLDEGKEIVGLFISTTLSGTYQAAMAARNTFSGEEQSRIYLTDSRQTTGSLALLVLAACRMRDQGFGAEEISSHILSLIPRARLYAILDTIKYLKMGGRLSTAAAVTGGLLNIVPIVMLDDGHIEAIAKIRKSTNGFRKFLREKINSDLPDPQYPVIYLHSNNPALTEPIQEEFKYLVSPDNAYRLSICGVVGVHVGPGAIGMAYIARA